MSREIVKRDYPSFFFALMSFRLYRSRACTFHCSWLSRTSQIYPKCSVDRVRQGLGYEGIGDPIKRVQLRFSLRVDDVLVVGIARVLCMAAWRYRTSQIYPKCSVDIFGRALIVEVSASKSSVLDFVFATCCWRSGCIEVQIAHFDRE